MWKYRRHKLVNSGDILQRHFDRFNHGLYMVNNRRPVPKCLTVSAMVDKWLNIRNYYID